MDKDFLENERKIDLCSIKKIDSTIVNILDKTDKVAFYKFDGASWHKQDVEGSMFVFSRSVSPYYGFIIQNRRSLSDNVCELLVDGMEFQRSNLYLLYKTNTINASDTGIRSIWFEDETGCLRISTLLNKLLRMRNDSPTEASNNILKFFEKSNGCVRQSASPTQTNTSNVPCERNGHHSPRHGNTSPRHNKKSNRHCYGNSFSEYGNNRHNEHGGSNCFSDGNSKSRNGNNNQYHGNNNQQHRYKKHLHGNSNNRHSFNEYNGKRHSIDYSQKPLNTERQNVSEFHVMPKTEKKNLLNMFNQAHKRYKTKPEQHSTQKDTVCENNKINKPVTIMKRGQPHIPNTTTTNIVDKPSKSCSNVTDIVNKQDTEPSGACKNKKCDLNEVVPKNKQDCVNDTKGGKGIAITFQDLVNSVQQPKQAEVERPLSCYSIGSGSSGSSVEDVDIVISGNEADQSSPTSGSGSDQVVENVTKSVKDKLSLNESSKLLMSPLDFQKLAAIKPPTHNPSPVKRALFSNTDDSEDLSFKSSKKSSVIPDMKQFKEFLISAIQEDDDLVDVLYKAFSKRCNR